MDFSILVLLCVRRQGPLYCNTCMWHFLSTTICFYTSIFIVYLQLQLLMFIARRSFECLYDSSCLEIFSAFRLKTKKVSHPFFFSWELYNGLLFVLLKNNILSCLITDVIGVAQLCNKTNGMLTKIRIILNVFWNNMNYHYEKILVWL